METKACQNCKNDFTIDERDQNFYAKIHVPHPTWCPDCRIVRRFAMQNTWNLTWRNCDKCGERTLCVFTPEFNKKVYCQPCWWADDWDGSEYAMDYDPSRPFLAQVKELADKTPYAAMVSLYTSNKNCDYSNALAWSKDCSLVFWADFCDNVYYSTMLNTVKYSADCLGAKNCEYCYEGINLNKSYRTFFSEECDSCVDVMFSRDCRNCTNCIGCANLRNASHCIFNVKYGKEEYAEKVKEMGLDTWSGLQAVEEQAQAFWLTQPCRFYSGDSLNLNVSGDYVYESKNAHEMYLCEGAEDCKWCQFITVTPAKDCYDYSGWGNNASNIYEAVTTGEESSNVHFAFECWPHCLDIEYGIWNISGNNNFGCVNLKRKEYSILNKEYSKEEYLTLKAHIIEDMKNNPYTDKTGKVFPYGEFFPPEFSNFPYNKSNAMRFFPKSKEEALSQGYTWTDVENPTIEATIKAQSLPETIIETTDEILNETIECANCKRAYKITQGEFELLKKMNLSIPHHCPACRQNARFSKLNSPKLYDRACHKCGKEIRTPFAPDKPDIIYCETCYNQEVG